MRKIIYTVVIVVRCYITIFCCSLGIIMLATAQLLADDATTIGMARIGKLILPREPTWLSPTDGNIYPAYKSLYRGIYDNTTGFAYFATAGSVDPAYVFKIDLKTDLPQLSDVIRCSENGEIGIKNLLSGVVDPTTGFAYFGSTNSPGKVVKIKIANGEFKYIGSISLDAGPNDQPKAAMNLQAAIIDLTDPDPSKHYIYFAANGNSPGLIAKVAPAGGPVVNGEELPKYLESVEAQPAEKPFGRTALLDDKDPANQYGYFPTGNGQIVKVRLGDNFKYVGSVTVPNADERRIGSGVIDLLGPVPYGYFGTYDKSGLPARIIKIKLGSGDDFRYIGSIALQEKEFELSTAVIDAKGGYAYFGTDHTFPAKIYKIALNGGEMLSDGELLPARGGYLQLNPGTLPKENYPPDGGNILADADLNGELFLQSSMIDVKNKLAYFGTDTFPGQIVKVSIGTPEPTPSTQPTAQPIPTATSSPTPTAIPNDTPNENVSDGIRVLANDSEALIKNDRVKYTFDYEIDLPSNLPKRIKIKDTITIYRDESENEKIQTFKRKARKLQKSGYRRSKFLGNMLAPGKYWHCVTVSLNKNGNSDRDCAMLIVSST